MKKMIFTLTAILACIPFLSQGQATSQETPKGQAILQFFGNFHSGFGSTRNDRGFELDRSYVGYQYNLGEGLEIKGVMDIGQSNDIEDYQRIAYIKLAQITWKTGDWILQGGLIPTTQVAFQDKFWGHRYIWKTFQDRYKFGNSADLGVSASYQFTEWISADATILNGEGFKKIQTNDGLLYGVGTTITPLKGLHIRIYGSLNEGYQENEKDILNLATLIGYQGKFFSAGIEYNAIQNYDNQDDKNLSGYSVYGIVTLNPKTEIYARLDDLYSKADWNKAKDETALIAGMQFKLGKYVKLAPNFQMYIPKSKNADNTYAAYINFSFSL